MDRWFTNSKFQESARYSAGRLRDAGVSDVEIIQAPADGKSIFADWMMPLAAAVGSVMKLVGRAEWPSIRAQVRGLQNDLRRAARAEANALARKVGRAKHRPGEPSLDVTLSAIHPRRLVPGPLTLDCIPLAARGGRPDPRWSPALFSVLCWCDGKRSLAEACHLAARELRRERTLSPDELARQIDPNASGMLEYFEFLRKHGYLGW